jgi:hypothetical protein
VAEATPAPTQPPIQGESTFPQDEEDDDFEAADEDEDEDVEEQAREETA